MRIGRQKYFELWFVINSAKSSTFRLYRLMRHTETEKIGTILNRYEI